MMDYVIVSDTNPDTVGVRVSAYLNKGYKLHGKLKVVKYGTTNQFHKYIQALVKE